MTQPLIHFILTGGTIDAQAYDSTPSNITPLAKSIIPETLETLGLAKHCTFTHQPHKDSKNYTEADVLALATIAEQSPQQLIIITHGTDRMVEHARMVKAALTNTQKMVLFTGAMTPIMNEKEGISPSDGPQNLAFACAQLASPQSGTHIAFHQKLHNPDTTVKDFDRKLFVQNT